MIELTGSDYVGERIYIDEWGMFSEIDSVDYWDKAEFRITTHNDLIPTLAARIHVTGRTPNDKPGLFGESVIRIKVTIVGDCEPDAILRGWIPLRAAKNLEAIYKNGKLTIVERQ